VRPPHGRQTSESLSVAYIYAHGRAQAHGLFSGHDRPGWNDPLNPDFLGYSWAGNRYEAAQAITAALLQNFVNP